MKECPSCGACFDDEAKGCPEHGGNLRRSFGGPRLIGGRYRLERLLGKGGMGAVYRGQHVGLNKPFAVKLILPQFAADEEFLRRFRREAHTLGLLRHPNIVTVTDYGVDAREVPIPYLVMELLEGLTLHELIQRQGKLALPTLMPILNGIAAGLDHAHEHNILHRDIKPKNVFLVDGLMAPASVRLLDFGLASIQRPASADTSSPPPQLPDAVEAAIVALALPVTAPIGAPAPIPGGTSARTQRSSPGPADETLEMADLTTPLSGQRSVPPINTDGLVGLTAASEAVGTPHYVAPESVLHGNSDRRSDIYSLAALAFEGLTGRVPFTGTLPQVLWGHQTQPPPLPSVVAPAVPVEVDAPILAGLAKNAAERPARAADLVAALGRAAGAAERRQFRHREWPRRAGLAAVIALLVTLAGWAVRDLAPVVALENKGRDALARQMTPRPPELPLVLLSIDEPTLAADSEPLAAKADEFGAILSAVMAGGAKGVALDLLLPTSWGRSPEFTRFVVQNRERVVLAALSNEDGTLVGPEALSGLPAVALGETAVRDLFGFVNTITDRDQIVRRVAAGFPTLDGSVLPSFAGRCANLLGRGSPDGDRGSETKPIDFAVDWQRWPRFSWKDVQPRLAEDPDAFRGQLVLVGGEYAGAGDVWFQVPSPPPLPDQISGVMLQALMVESLAGSPAVRYGEPAPPLRLAAGLGLLVALAFLLARRWMVPLMAALLAVALPIAIAFRRAGDGFLTPLVPALIAVVLAVAVAAAMRSLLSQPPELPEA